MNLNAHLCNFTTLTAPELSSADSSAARERRKTAQQRAEDFMYIGNHTATCLTFTDLLIVPVLRGLGMNIGHAHHDAPTNNGGGTTYWKDTTPEPTGNGTLHNPNNCTIPGHKHGVKFPTTTGHYEYVPGIGGGVRPPIGKRIWGEIKHAFGHFSWRGARNWFVGEAIGDVGAMVVTIPVQRVLPGVMDSMRSVLEPVAGGFFRRGAKSAANRWADKHGMARDSQEVVDRARELYEYEMRHLPQMAVWTLSSIGLHYGVMRFLERDITVGQFARQKAATSAITAGLVFGARAMSPDRAHKWDQTMGGKVVVPITKKIGRVFGVEERDVDDFHRRQAEQENKPSSWTNKVSQPASAEAAQSAARA